uniref:Putative secreted protein n=1 Tax=Ixodes ricinus TaxID=34613 RepID=A0A090XET9_IXORI
MFQSYIIKISLYLLLILKFHINGAQRREVMISYNTFINKVVTMVQQELHERLNGSMYRVQLPDHLVSVSGRSISLGEDRLMRIFGLTFKLWRNGNCEKWSYNKRNHLHCPVKFDDLKIQLPQLGNKGTVYVVHVTIKGTLVFQEGKDQMLFQRFIWDKKDYEIMNSDGKPVNPPPAAYCLKAKSTSSLKVILQRELENLIKHGLFKSAMESSLKKIPKPMSKAKAIIKSFRHPRTLI